MDAMNESTKMDAMDDIEYDESIELDAVDIDTTPAVTSSISEQAAARMNALTEARTACTSGLKATDGMIIKYARAISEVCGEGWVHLVGKESAPVREERKLFNRAMGLPEEVLTDADKRLRAKCNTYWQRVREAAGYVTPNKAKAATDIDSKTLAELKTMLNRIDNAEGNGVECPLASAAKGNLIDAFLQMGGDIDALGTKG